MSENTTPTIEQAIDLAVNAHRSGNLPMAESIYRQVLEKAPQNGVAMHFLGVIAHEVGKNEIAEKLIAASMPLLPADPIYLNNLGSVYRELGRFDEAEQIFRRALQLDPAAEHVHNNLGLTLMDQHRLDEAIPVLREAARLYPNDPKPYANLGPAYTRTGRFADAERELRVAIQLEPRMAVAHLNLANALGAMNRMDEALAVVEAALAFAPHDADLHIVRGYTLLKLGRLAEGFAESEWRLRAPRGLNRKMPQPLWNGEPLEGRSILLYGEQGFGDAIQFARYVPLIAERGARVIMEAPPPLTALFASLQGVDHVVAPNSAPASIDYRCSLLSLPALFGTELTTIPRDVPYLSADPVRMKTWAHKLGPRDGSFRVGLVWAGDPNHYRDRVRSTSFAQLAPSLATVPQATFYSLQKRPAAAQASAPPDGMRLIDLAPDLHDLADLAAAMMNLDLVISVDTAPTHLAGALGCEVWTLLSHASEWRWLLGRDDSPWYPTMKLFRQPTIGDWHAVAELVASALTERVRKAEIEPMDCRFPTPPVAGVKADSML